MNSSNVVIAFIYMRLLFYNDYYPLLNKFLMLMAQAGIKLRLSF